jgi:glycosyltransferase involved in cell wall biosynthesis
VRIGLIASPWIPVPPPRYGGTEAVVDNLARGLRDAGHDVDLFTIGESRCDVNRSWIFQNAVEDLNNSMYEAIHVEAAYRSLAHVDIIHDHTTIGPLLGSHAAPAGVPVVTTAHGPFHTTARQMYSRLPDRVSLIAISHPHRASAPDLDVTAVIPHGIDTHTYVAGPGGGGYLAFVGRMNPDKGVHRAIEVARRAGLPLVIMAKIREAVEVAYFEDVIKPLLGSDVELLIEPEHSLLIDLVGRAEALINPIMWPEPFGLVMAEALSCGTPVIASPHGAAQEIVEHGKTGYLYQEVDDLVEAVGRRGDIDRADCRAAAERRFSMQRMVDDHVRLYRRLIDQAQVTSLIGRTAVRSRPAAAVRRKLQPSGA